MEQQKEIIIKNREFRIKKEVSKQSKLFSFLDKDMKAQIDDLIKSYAFLVVMAEDMKEEMKECDSYLTLTVNASQKFLKVNPLAKELRETIKSLQFVKKQIYDMTKSYAQPDELDELEKFIK